MEEDLKRSQENADRIKAERVELDRKEHLRKKDPDVDPIFRSLFCAKFDLQHLLGSIDDFDVTPEDIAQLRKWTQDHLGVMDFCLFREIREKFPQPGEKEPVLFKEEIEELLEEGCDAGSFLAYADAKLGIRRGHYLWDGDNSGGEKCERGNGRYEDKNTRYEKILRSFLAAGGR